jgi:hypothetical protein
MKEEKLLLVTIPATSDESGSENCQQTYLFWCPFASIF